LKSLFIKFARLALVLTVGALLLTACGAGVSEVANPPSNGTVTAVVSPARVLAGKIYTYQATATSGSAVTWNWGDGSPDSVGTTVQKVWNKSGNQTITLSATASGKTVAVAKSVAVSGEPVSAGRNHTCALQPSGTVLCWGSNSNGQLGGGANVGLTATVAVTSLTDAVALSAGALHTCAIRAGGTVVCWGDNSSSQMGDSTSGGTKPTLVAVTGLTGVVAISAGQSHTCALQSNGNAQCWGANIYGQVGDGTNGTGSNRATATAVIGLTDAVAISAGELYTCALKSNGSAVCWGYNGSGQLGDGTIGNFRTTTVAVTGLADAVALSAGYEHACALKANGSAACWGLNSSGEVGDSTTVTRTITTAVTGLTDAVAISAGGYANASANGNQYRGRSCAIKANGSAVCWGDSGYAGSGSGVVQATPTAVAGLTDTAALSLGGDHTCALKASGAIACWGNNLVGQIGDGTAGGVPTKLVAFPDPGGSSSLVLLTDTAELSAGGFSTCVRKTDGAVACWGLNTSGQLGNGITSTQSLSPTVVANLTNTVEISASWEYTCVRKTDSTVVCWGANYAGQLGNGTTTQSLTPTIVNNLTGTVELSAGYAHACARKTDGTVVCWGANFSNQLGNGTPGGLGLNPGLVANLTDTVQISSGGDHTCARKSDGTVVCWGDNSFGQLGNGTTTQSLTPTLVNNLTDTVEISTGFRHTCARKKDNSVVCWGLNNNGQLGNGVTATQSVSPTVVTNLTDTVELTAGVGSTCARKSNGTVVCWGSNALGQLGDGTGTDSLIPNQPVSDLTDVVQLSSGNSHTCARKTDGTLFCWGFNGQGQLGSITTVVIAIKPIPTAVLGGTIFWR
jgi:alpha-tubulin suppressor-like RCC1 family protein